MEKKNLDPDKLIKDQRFPKNFNLTVKKNII